MSDYLWDKSGEADGDVERLEELLGRLRHAGAAPELPFEAGTQASSLELKSHASTRAGLFSHAFFSRPARLAAAAALLLAVLAGAFALMRMVKKAEGRASVVNEIQVARPHAPEEVKPREEVSAPQVVSSTPKESATPEPLQREPLRRVELVTSKPPVKSQRREPAPRETVASQPKPRDVKTAMAQGGVFEGRGTEVDSRVRAKEQLVYALRLTSEALKQVRGRASGVEVRPNAFDGRSPLR
jgi:hypothetical protein